MRVHFLSIATIAVALLFVSGTVGCRNNGGNWYDPRSYSLVNPFDRDAQSSRPSDAFANTRPSFGAHPDISVPPGGYSDASSFAGRSAANPSALGGHSPEPWGHQNQVGSHTPPSHLGGFTVAEPSHLPTYGHMPGHMSGHVMDGQSFGSHHNHIASAPQQQIHQQHAPPHSQFPHQFPQGVEQQQHHIGQHHNPMGQHSIGQQQNSMPFGPSDYTQTGFHQSAQHQIPAGLHGMEPQGNHAFGVMPQHGPHSAMQQQAVTVPPAGFGFEHQPAHVPQQHVPQHVLPGDGGGFSNNRRRRQQVDFLRQRAVDSISGNSTTGKGDIKKNDWGVSGSRNFRSGCFMMWETKFNVSEKQKSPQLAKANLL